MILEDLRRHGRGHSIANIVRCVNVLERSQDKVVGNGVLDQAQEVILL